MRDHPNSSPPPKLGEPEEYTVENGRSLVEVRTTGDSFAEAFLINGKPVTLSWSAHCGSILQNLIRTGHGSIAAELTEFRDHIATGFDPTKPMAKQIQPVLNLLPSGPYKLAYTESTKDYSTPDDCLWEAIEFDPENLKLPSELEGFLDCPRDPTIFCTVPSATLDQSRIERFVKEIREGSRPPLILLQADDGVWDLLIDGHHKLQAYRRLKLIPAYVRVTALKPPHISHEEAHEAIVGDASSLASFDECLSRWKHDISFLGCAGTPKRTIVGVGIIAVLCGVTIWVWQNL
jgi:hypothetical protein